MQYIICPPVGWWLDSALVAQSMAVGFDPGLDMDVRRMDAWIDVRIVKYN